MNSNEERIPVVVAIAGLPDCPRLQKAWLGWLAEVPVVIIRPE